jgi:hypothetical protein
MTSNTANDAALRDVLDSADHHHAGLQDDQHALGTLNGDEASTLHGESLSRLLFKIVVISMKIEDEKPVQEHHCYASLTSFPYIVVFVLPSFFTYLLYFVFSWSWRGR